MIVKSYTNISFIGPTIVFDHVVIADENPTFRYVKPEGGSNVVAGFNVDVVDIEYRRLLPAECEMLNNPTTYPWCARSLQFRDLDGIIINFRSTLNG